MQTTRPTQGHRTRTAALAFAAATALLAGCGGGSNSVPLPTIKSVKVMGDSLADAGTFGFKFTIQGVSGIPVPIYPEIIAQSYGLTQHCAYYEATAPTTFVTRTSPSGCTNFAIGGGRINTLTAGLPATSKLNIGVQLQDAVETANHTENDLLIIDGGGNDAADVVGLYLGIATGGSTAIATYAAALKTVLPAADVDSRLTSAQGLADLGGLYMKALATRFAGQIKTQALDKGAKHVVLINLPAITLTPRFQSVLAAVAAGNGGGTTGATARAAADALFNNWIDLFNTELKAQFDGNSSVMMVDVNAALKDQVKNPTTYGLLNVTDTACPGPFNNVNGLPLYFLTCTVVALGTNPPAGSTGGGNWYQSYLFSDGFHPSGRGHQLAAEQIRSVLFNNSRQ